MENLSRALAAEYTSKGIAVQCQSPLWVATSMTFPNSKVAVEKRATLFTPTARTYAKYAVARIGYDVMVSPYPAHELYIWLQERLPEALKTSVILGMHKKARRATRRAPCCAAAPSACASPPPSTARTGALPQEERRADGGEEKGELTRHAPARTLCTCALACSRPPHLPRAQPSGALCLARAGGRRRGADGAGRPAWRGGEAPV